MCMIIDYIHQFNVHSAYMRACINEQAFHDGLLALQRPELVEIMRSDLFPTIPLVSHTACFHACGEFRNNDML